MMALRLCGALIVLVGLNACNPLISSPSTDQSFGSSTGSTPVPFNFSAQSSVLPATAQTIVIDFVSSAGGSLQPASAITGFSVKVNGTSATVTSASRTSSTEVTLVLTEVVASTDTVTFSYTSGNVVDSQGVALPAITNSSVTNSSVFDADATTYFNAVTANGGTLSAASKTATQTLITSLKTASLWSKLIEIYPFQGDQLAAALMKLKVDSSSPATLVNHGFISGDYIATGSSGGLQGNGAKYVDSGLSVPGLSRYDISFGAYVTVDNSTAASFGIIMGSSYSATGDNDRFYLMGGGAGTGGQPALGNFYPDGIVNGIGLRLLTYDGTNIAAYRNASLGAGQADAGITWQQTGTVLIYKGAGPYYHDGRIPFAFVGKALSSSDISNLYSAVQAFETALGRNI